MISDENITKKVIDLIEHAATLKRLGSLKSHPDYWCVVQITSFLDGQHTSVAQRLWHISNNTFSKPSCKMCDNPAPWEKTKGGFYRPYCSSKCAHSDPQVKELTKQTNLQKYNNFHHSQSNIVKEKKKKTSLKKWGVDNPSKSPVIKEKKKQTSLKNWGTAHPVQSEVIQSKIAANCIVKYGTANVLNSEHGKKQRKETSQLKYGVDIPSASQEVRDKIRNTTLSTQGKYHNWCTGTPAREKQQRTMIDRYGQSAYPKLTQEQYTLLNDSQLLTTMHHEEKLTIQKIATNIGVNSQTVSNYFKQHDIDIMTRSSSQGERDVFDFLQTLLPEECLEQNTRSIIPPLELDIYIQSHNIAIEYCGLYWHSEQMGKDKWYHHNKFNKCAERGIQLFTIFEDEWINHQDIIKQKFQYLVNQTTERVYARNCVIAQISKSDCDIFLNKNHIQQTGNGSIRLGLYHNDCLVAACLFQQQRNGVLLLQRFATGCNVVGGFSKIIKHVQRTVDFTKIVTFADQRWSVGKLYQRTGFTLEKTLPPDYFYSQDGQIREHKFNYRRKNLPRKLMNFDSSLSERVNCNNNNILRIWDCGKQRWVLHNN